MRIGDVLYFSPTRRFADLDFDNPTEIVEAFAERTQSFLLDPARSLIDGGYALAAGLVCCAAIEFIARGLGYKSPEAWLACAVPPFKGNDDLANRFWVRFRHGLAHEGRAKPFGQFSLEIGEVVVEEGGHVIVINPRWLLDAVAMAFRQECEVMDDNRRAFTAQKLKRDFQEEAHAARKLAPDQG